MKRTKEWWQRLEKWERKRLFELEHAYSCRSAYLPDDCCDCGGCGLPTLGYGLCKACNDTWRSLLDKANEVKL